MNEGLTKEECLKKHMNFEAYKSDSLFLNKFLKKIVRAFPKSVLINELKRRRLIKFNWLTNKFDEVEK